MPNVYFNVNILFKLLWRSWEKYINWKGLLVRKVCEQKFSTELISSFIVQIYVKNNNIAQKVKKYHSKESKNKKL